MCINRTDHPDKHYIKSLPIFYIVTIFICLLCIDINHINMKNFFVIYDKQVQYINTINAFDSSFKRFSENDVHEININDLESMKNLPSHPELNNDSIIIGSYAIIHNMSTSNPIHFQACKNSLRNLNNTKCVFIQDEYYHVDKTVEMLNEMRVDVIFTVLTRDCDIKTVYKNIINKNTIYIKCLTGYIDENPIRYFKPISDKPNGILYRGRKLHPLYGLLGYYKFEIGYNIKQYIIAQNINLAHDISSNNEDRIYGDWNEAMTNAKITLGTPSGSNVLNYDTTLHHEINTKIGISGNGHLLQENDKSYSDKKFIDAIQDARTKVYIPEILSVNALSPKMFEAISAGTVLVMLEGDDLCYSGILKPDIHYIPLKKDYSNLDEVMNKCMDDVYLQTLANRAYEDIVFSEKYSFRTMIKSFDHFIQNLKLLPNNIYNIYDFDNKLTPLNI